MKKTYTKPEICFESFLMSTNIAGDCEVKPTTYGSYNMCGHEYGTEILFGTDLGGCKKYPNGRLIAPGTGAFADRLCYHTPTEASNIFNS